MTKTSIKILLDNGHGINTQGKRSPDGRLLEYKYTREIVKMIYDKLKSEGFDAVILTPEEYDVSLSERVKRANLQTTKQTILISVHCNAASSDGKWHSAKGWSVFIAQNASNNSKRLADCLANSAEQQNLKVRYYMPGQSYWVQSLAICRDTKCPAVLTENLFQDNKEDVDFLLSDQGKQTIVDLHVNAIKQYAERY